MPVDLIFVTFYIDDRLTLALGKKMSNPFIHDLSKFINVYLIFITHT